MKPWIFAASALVFMLLPLSSPATTLDFARTPYGLLFVDISVDGQPVTAMIDFGDPYPLQLASSFLQAHDLETRATGKRAVYADGTEFELLEGTAGEVRIGNIVLKDLTFGSAPGEIDAVAEQIGMPFQAALGWGFFGGRSFVLDYRAGRIDLDIQACPSDAEAVVREPGASHLVVGARVDGRETRLLIDTGNPVNVLDQTAFGAAGEPTVIEHVAGRLAGRAIDLVLNGRRFSQAFEMADLSALAPLGAEGILGAPFLESVRLCHDPGVEMLDS
ncbi:MAG: aspartyl protease family protein [Wenzhouxiangella sp.]|jgi:hypothetical protein|nr:aspartyl protease family protein [Wenzhouxiangella sp.]